MAETVGLILLSSLGYGEIAGTILFGSITVGAAVGSTALVGGAALYGALSMGSTPSRVETATPKPADGAVTLRQQIPPRVVGYGQARIAGAYMLFEVNSDGDSDDIIALHHGKVASIDRIYLNEDEVTINGSGDVNAAYNVHAIGYSDQRYGIGLGNFVNMGFHLGTDPATAFGAPGLSGLGWTSAHRGDGQASAFLRCRHVPLEDHWKVFPRGLPKLSVVATMTAVFDPRDGAQSRDNPATWTVSKNPVLQAIDKLTSAHHGMALDWDEIIAPNLTALMAQADICDEVVAKVGGTEPRYRSNGWFYMTTDDADVLSEILATCDGWLTEMGNGSITIVVGKYQAPTGAPVTDEHIVGFSIDGGVADEESVNQIKWSYTEPLNAYRQHPGDPWSDDLSISESGRIRPQSRTLTWVQSHSQGRRLMKRVMARYQARLRGTLAVNLFGLTKLGQRWIAVQSSLHPGLSDAVIEITKAKVDILNARVTFDWVLVNPNEIDAFDPSEEEGTRPIIP